MNQQGVSQATGLEDEETRILPTIVHQRSISASFSQSASQSAKTVWIIDDSPTVRSIVSLHLSRLPVTVLPFKNGREAFLYLRDHGQENQPFLVLLDIEMPGIDGIEVLQTLRGLPWNAQPAIVMMSGRDNVESRLQCRLAGATDYLIKPTPCEVLLAVALAYLHEAIPQPQAPGMLEACHV